MVNIKNIVKDQIISAGLKVTWQRMAVLEAVITLNNHPTAEEIHHEVRKNNSTVSLSTIYNNLEILFSNGLLKRLWGEDGQKRYDAKKEDHAHILCTNTQEIVDYQDEELNNLIVNYFKKKKVNNLKIKNITLNIKGEKLDPKKPINIK